MVISLTNENSPYEGNWHRTTLTVSASLLVTTPPPPKHAIILQLYVYTSSIKHFCRLDVVNMNKILQAYRKWHSVVWRHCSYARKSCIELQLSYLITKIRGINKKKMIGGKKYALFSMRNKCFCVEISIPAEKLPVE